MLYGIHSDHLRVLLFTELSLIATVVRPFQAGTTSNITLSQTLTLFMNSIWDYSLDYFKVFFKKLYYMCI